MTSSNSQGYSKPIVEIYTGGGRLITTSSGRSVGKEVHKFNYVYDEEGDDTCNVVFRFDDPSLVDHPSLRPDTLILVKWGYQGGNMSPRRLIAIRDTVTDYDANGIRHELICTDQIAYLKTIQHNINEQKGFVEWLSGLTQEKLNNIRIALKIRNKPKVVWDPNASLPSGGDINSLNGLITIRQDNTRVEIIKPVVPAGASVYRVIKKETELLPGGPYIMDGRDNTLNIRPRNFSGAVIKTYTIVKGTDEVLSFNPKSRIRKNEMEATEYGSLNPENGTGTVGAEIDLDSPVVRELETEELGEPNFTTTNIDDPAAAIQDILKKEYQREQETGIEIDPTILLDNVKILSRYNNRSGAYLGNNGLFVEPRDNLFVDIMMESSLGFHYSQAEQLELAKRKLENLIKAKHHNKYQAELTVLGNPSLVVNRSLFVTGGIARRHKGKYYIKKVTHRIDMTGYTSSCEVIKTPANIKVVAKESTSNINEWPDHLNYDSGSSQRNYFDKERMFRDDFQEDEDGYEEFDEGEL